MKSFKYILTILLFGFSISGFAQHECDGGDNDNNNDNEHPWDDGGGANTSAGISADPNEIIGPTGFGDSIRWVSVNDILNYSIMFENDPEFATANAQKVDVRFTFDDKAYMKGFGLSTFGFANMSWPVENTPAAYQNRMDVRDSIVGEKPMQIFVDLTAGVDVTKKQAFWTFNSIDPETGLNPWQVDRGMLPVNDSTHVGEGFVTFKLKPYEGLKTGDTISIAANIVFDQNDTIPTNRWRNTIDAGLPTSKVKGRVDSKMETLYHITMQASDDEGGSGLKHVRLYLANNFGIYEEYAVCPVDTVIDFEAEKGKQYKFFSLAEDNVGNREPLKEEADFIININAAPTDIALSDTIFQDDIMPEGFIGEMTSVDTEEGGKFTYELAEGDGAIHNDLFMVKGSQLLAKNTFKCAEDTVYQVRLSTTDEGGLSYSKPFRLHLKNVLEKPKTDTLTVQICHDETFVHHGIVYSKTGVYHYSESNEYLCDSTFVINLTVLPQQSAPAVSVEGLCTLVSSVDNNNQWFYADGTPIADATEQKYTPTEDGIYYVVTKNGNCYSDASKAYRVQLSDNINLDLDLAKGWNWVSSNLSDAGYKKATDFVKPIEDKVERLVGFDKELVRDPNLGLVGNLNELDPTESYMLQTNEAVKNVWAGVAYKLETIAISLKKGWNWIGYMPVLENSLANSLSTLSPSEGDVIKGYDSFATYCGGKWIGTLESLAPGLGYMYHSNTASTFNYPAIRVFEVSDGNSSAKTDAVYGNSVPWHMESNKYPYNMTVIANVYAKENQAPVGYFTIGAFVGNECRGIGRYVDDKLFMTIYGDITNNETVNFRAYDNVTLTECSVVEKTSFANAMIGSVTSPFKLTVDATTGIAGVEQSGKYNIYPNPVHSTLYINGDISRISSVKVIATNGMTVAQTDHYSEGGLNVSNLVEGAYIAVVNTEDGIVVKKIIKVQ